MKTSADKIQKNNQRAVANNLVQKHESALLFQLADNRPEALLQRKCMAFVNAHQSLKKSENVPVQLKKISGDAIVNFWEKISDDYDNNIDDMQASLALDGKYGEKGYDADDVDNLVNAEEYISKKGNNDEATENIRKSIASAKGSPKEIERNTAEYIQSGLTNVYALTNAIKKKHYFPKMPGAHSIYGAPLTYDEIMDPENRTILEQKATAFSENGDLAIVNADERSEKFILTNLVHELQHIVDGTKEKADALASEDNKHEHQLRLLLFKTEIRAFVLSGEYKKEEPLKLFTHLMNNYPEINKGIESETEFEGPFYDILEGRVTIDDIINESQNPTNKAPDAKKDEAAFDAAVGTVPKDTSPLAGALENENNFD